MMRRSVAVLGLATLLTAAFSAQAADSALLQKVLLLDLAETLGLDDAQTVDLMASFKDYLGDAAPLEATRTGIVSKIEAADKAADLAADLTQLKDADQKLAALRASAAASMSSGLSSALAAKVYVFMSSLDALTAKSVCGAPCAAASATATCAAGTAQAAEAAAPKSDDELIKATVDKVKKALESLNLDMLLETFSENFNHPEVGGKEEARYMLEMGIDMGYAEDGEVNTDDMEIEIDGNEATVYPIELGSPAGSVTIELVLAKEGDQWLITTLNPDGM